MDELMLLQDLLQRRGDLQTSRQSVDELGWSKVVSALPPLEQQGMQVRFIAAHPTTYNERICRAGEPEAVCEGTWMHSHFGKVAMMTDDTMPEGEIWILGQDPAGTWCTHILS